MSARIARNACVLSLAACLLLGFAVRATAEAEGARLSPEELAFFESKIRPLFVENCYKCHSTEGEKIKGGLLLDSRQGVLKGGDSGPPIVPGDPDASLLIQAVRYADEELQMPPKRKLSDQQIRDLEEWIKMGAPDPRLGNQAAAEEPGPVFTAAERSHWAYQKVVRPDLPSVHRADWVSTPVDAFILAELESRGLSPSPSADKITLLRRATFDLVGLPPTLEEIDDFLNDDSPAAFERVVDRLLASPHYGERWGRHWLDLARFAETDGFKEDGPREHAWRYRDYVIRSFNEDKPYDRFIQEQIAGDELWPHDPDAKIATAFNRHYPDEWNARNLMQRRQEILNDITDTVGSVFMGLTVACARCHNHKYDAIRQADYYRLQAFFANTAANDNIVLVSPEAEREYHDKLAVWEEKTRHIRAEMEELEAPHRQAMIKEYVDKYPPEIQAMLLKDAAERTPYERQMVAKARQYIDPAGYAYLAATSKVVPRLKGEQKQRWEELKKQLDEFAPLKPAELALAMGVSDLSAEAPATHLLNRGAYDAPKEPVEPGFLSVLDPKPATIVRPNGLNSTGRRSALARLLTHPDNPVTARVMVNRIWQYHFGRGLVGTASDFGVKGDRPTHPALLDWLADEFAQRGWSIKQMHRLIMLSSAYRQASDYRHDAAQVDLDSLLLWRAPRQRLEAEVIRDAILATAGILNTAMGGPGVFPELPPSAANRGGLWKVSPDPDDRNRRSIYIFVRRNNRYPLLDCFDAPDTLETCARRNVTTTPLQALAMLNSELTLQWAQAFAGRVLQMAGAERDAQIATAFRLAYSRPPDSHELQMVHRFIEAHRPILAERAAAGEKLALPTPSSQSVDPLEASALVDLCHTLINSNEFIYRN